MTKRKHISIVDAIRRGFAFWVLDVVLVAMRLS
jgi:hypothetical protein